MNCQCELIIAYHMAVFEFQPILGYHSIRKNR